MASRSADFEAGPVSGAFLWPLRVTVLAVLVFVGLWLFAVVTQTVLAVRAHGEARAPALLAEVLERELDAAAILSSGPIPPLPIASTIAATTDDLVFGAMFGLMRAVMNLPSQWQRWSNQYGDVGGRHLSQDVLPAYDAYIQTARTANTIFAVRSALLVSALPLAVLLYTVAVVDGFVARAIRRARAGRESAGIYHRAKLAQVWLVAGAWMLFVTLPFNIDPRWFSFGAAIGFALLARTQVAWMKKYL